MREKNRAELRLTWDGREYSCRPTHRVIMMIEEEVLLHQLARKIAQGADAIPSSHLCWVVYCLLQKAGAPVTSEEVYDAAMDERLPVETLETVAVWVVGEVFGVAPQPREEDGEEPAEGKT
jgi:hypothetical protein